MSLLPPAPPPHPEHRLPPPPSPPSSTIPATPSPSPAGTGLKNGALGGLVIVLFWCVPAAIAAASGIASSTSGATPIKDSIFGVLVVVPVLFIAGPIAAVLGGGLGAAIGASLGALKWTHIAPIVTAIVVALLIGSFAVPFLIDSTSSGPTRLIAGYCWPTSVLVGWFAGKRFERHLYDGR